MTRAVVTGCNLAFAPGAAAALRSCRKFHPDVARYCYAPPADVEAVRNAIGDLGTVLAPPRTLQYVPDHWKAQLMAARVFMPRLPAEVVAWIDSDAMFCAPAPELWDAKPGRVNAVKDAVYNLGRMVPREAWDGYARVFGTAPADPGFNSGVMALRSADWADLPERYEDAVLRVGYRLYPHGFDQALLNGLFRDRVDWLPRPFNAHATFELGMPDDLRILHFTDNPKPWMPGFFTLQKAYALWLRHGVQDDRAASRAKAAACSALAPPGRFAYRAVRKAAYLLGFYRPTPLGVSEDASFLPTRLPGSTVEDRP
jgi:hypothetical protein